MTNPTPPIHPADAERLALRATPHLDTTRGAVRLARTYPATYLLYLESGSLEDTDGNLFAFPSWLAIYHQEIT